MNVCMYVLQVFFTGHYLQDVQWQFRWAILVLLVHVVLALRSTIHTYILHTIPLKSKTSICCISAMQVCIEGEH